MERDLQIDDPDPKSVILIDLPDRAVVSQATTGDGQHLNGNIDFLLSVDKLRCGIDVHVGAWCSPREVHRRVNPPDDALRKCELRRTLERLPLALELDRRAKAIEQFGVPTRRRERDRAAHARGAGESQQALGNREPIVPVAQVALAAGETLKSRPLSVIVDDLLTGDAVDRDRHALLEPRLADLPHLFADLLQLALHALLNVQLLLADAVRATDRHR